LDKKLIQPVLGMTLMCALELPVPRGETRIPGYLQMQRMTEAPPKERARPAAPLERRRRELLWTALPAVILCFMLTR
jgi:hypothetical protein